MINKTILSISLLLLIFSCKQKANFDYHIKTKYNKEIAANKITKCVETRIRYDTFENAKWKYLTETKYYDNNGLCFMKIRPIYNITNKRINGLLTMEPLSIEFEGNYDTTLYEYNNLGFLIKENLIYNHKADGSNWNNITEYTYDDCGNKLTVCYIRPDKPIACVYSEYKYDINNRILQRKDSADYDYYFDLSKPFKYSYDLNGSLIDDGSYKFILDENSNVIEEIPLQIGGAGAKYKLDNEGRIIKMIRNNLSRDKFETFDEEVEYYKYNKEALLIERKIIFKGKLSELYSYTYFN